MYSTKKPTKLPPCSKWHVWIGGEIEGSTDLSVPTLFVRSLKAELGVDRLLQTLKAFELKRIWFCKEFTYWPIVRYFMERGFKICLEVADKRTLAKMPKDIYEGATIYFKSSLPSLKPGDYVCHGPAFSDEAHCVGSGRKVTPEEYEKDFPVDL